MTLSRVIRSCEMIPRGYGVGYREPHFDAIRCYPIPLNLIVRLAREIHWKLMAPRWGARDRALASAYGRGFSDGGHGRWTA